MKKQTVNQQYQESQKLKQQAQSSGMQAQQKNQTEFATDFLKETEQAIQQSQQSIRQIQAGEYDQFQLAEQRLQSALTKLQQFKTMDSKLASGLPEAEKQQLEQAFHMLNQAGQTLTLVQQKLGQS